MNTFINFYQKYQPQIKEKIIDFNNDIKKEKITTIKGNIDVYCNLNEAGKMIRGVLILLGYNL